MVSHDASRLWLRIRLEIDELNIFEILSPTGQN